MTELELLDRVEVLETAYDTLAELYKALYDDYRELENRYNTLIGDENGES